MKKGATSGLRRRKRTDARTMALYAWVLTREFRWTLIGLVGVVAFAGLLYGITPHEQLHGARPGFFLSLYAAWMTLFAQPAFSPPETWYLQLLAGIYPLIGVVLIGEGIVRFAMLMVSRRRNEKEWTLVEASTYRDHIILCGIGHLGFRVLQQLIAQQWPVVAIEKDAESPFLNQARAVQVPILQRDMCDDEALFEAGVVHARAIIIATNNDLANVEVALDARRINPKIRVAMRLYDQKMASKLRDAFDFDFAFSSAALAAPTVAAMALDCKVVSAFPVGGVPHVTAEVTAAAGSRLAGMEVAGIEAKYGARVLALTRDGATTSPAPRDAVVGVGDALVVYAEMEKIPEIAEAARPRI